MTAPLDPRHLDDAIRLYLAGEPLNEIRCATGVGATVLHRARRARGVPSRPRADALKTSEIVADYVAGLSEMTVAQKHSTSRQRVRAVLVESGVEVRDRSAAGRNRADRMTAEQRRAQAVPAHTTWRGGHHAEKSLVAAALTRERRGRLGSEGEMLLYRMLRKQGLAPVPQKAVGKYNVDLAIETVAVEVLGGSWHLRRRSMHAQRSKHILDAGWHLVMVWDSDGRSTLGPGAAQYLIALLEELRRNPPAQRQYRVIGGDGHLLAACGADRDELPLVPPPRGR